MKVLILVLALLTLASCGPRKKVIVENPFDNSGNDARFNDLEQRVSALEAARISMIASINSNQSQITALELGQVALSDSLSALQTSVADLTTLTQDQIDALTVRMDNVESAIAALETSSSDNAAATAAAQASIDSLSDYVDTLVGLGTTESNYLRGLISSLEGAVAANGVVDGNQASAITTLQSQIAAAQTTINTLSGQIVTLQNNENIVSLIDPCGDGAGFDEVLFKMASGKVVGSFSENASGKNTRFSVLPQGNYQTTDGTSCNFSVSASNIVSW
jgi:TolA-binding protein